MTTDDQSKTPINPTSEWTNSTVPTNPISDNLAFELNFDEEKKTDQSLEIPEIKINNDDLASILDESPTQTETPAEDTDISFENQQEINWTDWINLNLPEVENQPIIEQVDLSESSNEQIKEISVPETDWYKENEQISMVEWAWSEESINSSIEIEPEETPEYIEEINESEPETEIETSPSETKWDTNRQETSFEQKPEEIELKTNDIWVTINEPSEQPNNQETEEISTENQNMGINIDSMIAKLEKNVETSVEATKEDLIKIPEEVSSSPWPFSTINQSTSVNNWQKNEQLTNNQGKGKKTFFRILIILLILAIFFYLKSAYPIETNNLTDNISKYIKNITQTKNSTWENITENNTNQNFSSGLVQTGTQNETTQESWTISILPEEIALPTLNINTIKETLRLQQSQAKDYMTIAKEKKNWSALRNSILIVRKTSTYLQTIDTATAEDIEKINKDTKVFDEILSEIKLAIDDKSILLDWEITTTSTWEDSAEKEFEELLKTENNP